ncbi:hypothetical protein PENTCL1PPCAC_11303 [Pristionchus entomophagus]|uniref:Uncharacterized protein n=1 Tax=Pristionchus entomophagus TaxID=358040 RepID=A0AAV5T657_9BILA|nr:hypothetical protein PENTCL1PPCAC_11303 [Pristionchus entomophagus]
MTVVLSLETVLSSIWMIRLLQGRSCSNCSTLRPVCPIRETSRSPRSLVCWRMRNSPRKDSSLRPDLASNNMRIDWLQMQNEIDHVRREADDNKEEADRVRAALSTRDLTQSEQMDARVVEADGRTKASEEKFAKLKGVYEKFRAEHLAALQKLGDLQREWREWRRREWIERRRIEEYRGNWKRQRDNGASTETGWIHLQQGRTS